MNRILFTFLLLVIFFTIPGPSFAHVLEKDEEIGAIMHMDPEDDPIAGAPTYFLLEFKDKHGDFDVANCTCKLSIYRDGELLASGALLGVKDKKNTGTAAFTFPAKGLYSVNINGASKDGDFKPFDFFYKVRVDRVTYNTTSTKKDWFKYVVLGGIAVVVAATLVMVLKKKK